MNINDLFIYLFNLFIYLLFKCLSPATAGSARINVKVRDKREEKEGIEALRVKRPTSSWAINALIGKEEQTRKKKREQRKHRERVSNPATLDPSGASYDPQGSDCEPILVGKNIAWR